MEDFHNFFFSSKIPRLKGRVFQYGSVGLPLLPLKLKHQFQPYCFQICHPTLATLQKLCKVVWISIWEISLCFPLADTEKCTTESAVWLYTLVFLWYHNIILTMLQIAFIGKFSAQEKPPHISLTFLVFP